VNGSLDEGRGYPGSGSVLDRYLRGGSHGFHPETTRLTTYEWTVRRLKLSAPRGMTAAW